MLRILFWPFRAVWSFVGLMFSLLGVLVSGIIGFGLMAAGLVLTFTIVGAVVGVPLVLLGGAMMVRSIF